MKHMFSNSKISVVSKIIWKNSSIKIYILRNFVKDLKIKENRNSNHEYRLKKKETRKERISILPPRKEIR